MTPVGETLRRERVKRNLDLEQISRELKISPRLLDAIEQEKFDRLPGSVFAKSFVRQYARLLGLDEDELAAEVQRQMEPQPTTPVAAETPRRPDIHMSKVGQWEAIGDHRSSLWSWVPALGLVVLVMLGCASVYTWWLRSRRPAPPVSATVSMPAPQVPATPPAVAPQPAPAPSEAQSSADRPAGEASAPQPSGQPAAPALGNAGLAGNPAPGALANPAAAGTAPASAAPANPNASVQVKVTAQEPVWVRAQSDGKYIFSGTLQANETRSLDAASEVQLRLGNAGGVDIVLNGKPIGPVGPKGQIRTVQLTSGGFKIVSAPKPAPVEPF
jgi:cytoskeleton protein RodZ